VSTLTAPHALSFLRSIAGIDESIVSRFTPTVQSLSRTTSLLACFVVFRIYGSSIE
jgi:hypothetical protein